MPWIEDPITGQVYESNDELTYAKTVRDAIVNGEIKAKPLEDGSWEFSAPQQDPAWAPHEEQQRQMSAPDVAKDITFMEYSPDTQQTLVERAKPGGGGGVYTLRDKNGNETPSHEDAFEGIQGGQGVYPHDPKWQKSYDENWDRLGSRGEKPKNTWGWDNEDASKIARKPSKGEIMTVLRPNGEYEWLGPSYPLGNVDREMHAQPAPLQQKRAVDAMRRMGLNNIADMINGMDYVNMPAKDTKKYGGLAYGPDRIEVNKYADNNQKGQVAIHEGLHGVEQMLAPETVANMRQAFLAQIRADANGHEDEHTRRVAASLLTDTEGDPTPGSERWADEVHYITYFLDDRKGGPPPHIYDLLRGIDRETVPPSGTTHETVEVSKAPEWASFEEEQAMLSEGAPDLAANRARLTGVNDPEVNNSIFNAISELPWHYQKQFAQRFNENYKATGDVEEAWKEIFRKDKYGFSFSDEVLKGGVSQAAWEATLDKAAMITMDPINAAGRAAVGAEVWDEKVPVQLRTVASLAPLLLAPQKGLLKDIAIGGMGWKAGTTAVGGALIADEAAVALGGNRGFAPELAGILLTGKLVPQRWLSVEGALKNGEVQTMDVSPERRQEFIDSMTSIEKLTPDEAGALWDDMVRSQEQTMTPEVARAIHDDHMAVKDALPDDYVMVWRQSGSDDFFADPEVAMLSAARNGEMKPKLETFSIPRRLLDVKDTVIRMKNRLDTALGDMMISGDLDGVNIPTVEGFIKSWVRGTDDAGTLFKMIGESPDDIDPAVAELIGLTKTDETWTLPEPVAGDAYTRWRASTSGGGWRVGDVGDDVGLGAVDAGMQDVNNALTSNYDLLDGKSDLGRSSGAFSLENVREVYAGIRKSVSEAQNEFDDVIARGGTEDEIFTARAKLMGEMKALQEWGEALALRTGNAEGALPRINRAVEQARAELEGAPLLNFGLHAGIPIPRMGRPNILKQGELRAGSQEVNYGPGTGPFSYGTAKHTVKLVGLRPVIPHLGWREEAFNAVRSLFHTDGGWDDPLGNAIAREDTRARVVLESRVNGDTAAMRFRRDKYFPVFKKGKMKGRIKDLPGNPYIQTVAARLPEYKPLLSNEQYQALIRMRETLVPWYNAAIEQGIEIPSRPDVMKGGFYLPRGNASIDGAIDMPTVMPSRKGNSGSSDKHMKFETMEQGNDAGYEYLNFDEAMSNFFRDRGNKVMNAYWKNVLETATDSNGRSLASTPTSRFLNDPANAGLIAKYQILQKQIDSLSRSMEGLDRKTKAAMLKFINSPEPDLSDLRNSLNRLSTKNGQLRVRMSKIDQQVEFRHLRQEILAKVYHKYPKGGIGPTMSKEQARKAMYREEMKKIRIRRGRFKGVDFDTGAKLLAKLKTDLTNLEGPWRDAKDRAANLPQNTASKEGQLGLNRTGFGVNMQGTALDRGLASSLNQYLKAQGKENWRVINAANNLLRGLRATADVSFMGIQGLIGLVHEPQSYGKAWWAAMRSLGDTNTLGRYIDEFDLAAARNGTPTTADWAAAGLRIGGMDTEYAVKGFGLQNAPVTSNANRAFGTFGDILRLDGVNSQYDIKNLSKMRPAERQKAMEEIAQVHNLMTGWSPNRFGGDLGGVFMFAPRFFQSQLELIGKALDPRETNLTKGWGTGVPTLTSNMATDQARRALIKLMGMGVTMTVLLNEAAGNDGFDFVTPFTQDGSLNSNFMRIRYQGRDFSLFGPWDSLMRATSYAAKGDPFYLARTKSSPMVGLAWDLITGENFMGDRVPKLKNLALDLAGEARELAGMSEYDSSGDWNLIPEYFLRSILPFSFGTQGVDLLTGETDLKSAATDIVIAATGAKASPLSPSERFNQFRGEAIQVVIGQGGPIDKMVRDGRIRPETATALKEAIGGNQWNDLSSTERKFVDKYIETTRPEEYAEWQQLRRENENIYQIIADQADGARGAIAKEYDELLQQLISGVDGKVVWEAYDKLRNQLVGRLAQIYEGGIDKNGKPVVTKETAEYMEAVSKLRPNDIRSIEEAYNSIIDNNRLGPEQFDWDKIDTQQTEFIRRLGATNPDMARRFVATLKLKEELDEDAAHPLVKLQRAANEQLAPYYDMGDAGATDEERQLWLIENPNADFARFITADWENATVNSIEAAEKAINLFAKSEAKNPRVVRISGSNMPITQENLPILRQYEKEITQLLTMPGKVVKDGKDTFPITELRKNDILYDALYFWMGFAPKSDKGTSTVYHDISSYISKWGPRHDGARPQLPR